MLRDHSIITLAALIRAPDDRIETLTYFNLASKITANGS
jgi:hypothetical protein